MREIGAYSLSVMLNKVAKKVLEENVIGLYTLDKEGQERVYASNINLKADYVESHAHHTHQFWFEQIRGKLSYVPPQNYGSVVDICCGSGYISRNIMKNQLFEKCYAIDINLNQLRRLKQILDSQKIKDVTLIRGDALNLPLRENSIDAAIGNSFLHHLPDNPKLLREIFRILKPGGVLCFTH